MWNPLYNRITAQSESGNRDYDRFGRPIRSPAGAMYAMQTMPGTARSPGFGVKPAADNSPAEYNRVGRDYRDAMFKRYGNDPAKGWGAYNWGPGNMDKALAQYGDNWLSHAPAETQAYVRKNVGQLGGDMKPTTLGDLIPYAMDVNGQKTPQLNVPEEASLNPASLMGGDLGGQATLGDLVQQTGLPKPGKGGVLGSGLSLGEILTYGINGYLAGRGNPVGQQNLQMIAQANNQEDERTYDLQKRREELDASKQMAMEAAAKPYRFQNNNGDVVEVNPMTGQTSVLYADPSPKPDWQKITDPTTGQISLMPSQSKSRPNEQHLQHLRDNPNDAAYFDAKFGAGMAEYYLRQMGVR